MAMEKLYNKVANDPEFAEKLKQVGSESEFISLVREEGIDISAEDIQWEVKQVNGELEEAALNKVSGGFYAKCPTCNRHKMFGGYYCINCYSQRVK